MIGGLPITQVIVRSSANIQSNAHTKVSAILHGTLLLVFALLLPHLLNFIPLSVLASILFVVGYKLAKPSIFRELYRSGMDQFLPFIITILGIVFTDLLLGIGLGMFCAVFMTLRRNFLSSFELKIKDHESPDHTHLITVKLAEEVSFFSRASVLEALSKILDNSEVVIDTSKNRHIDTGVVEVMEDFKVSTKHRSISLDWNNPTTS